MKSSRKGELDLMRYFLGGEVRDCGLQLPFCALMLLKPCKVKRFLAAAALSEVGLVSSDSEGQRGEQRGHKRREGQDELRRDRERGQGRHCDAVQTNSNGRVQETPSSLTFPCWFGRGGGVDVAFGLLLLPFLKALLTGSERTANGPKRHM